MTIQTRGMDLPVNLKREISKPKKKKNRSMKGELSEERKKDEKEERISLVFSRSLSLFFSYLALSMRMPFFRGLIHITEEEEEETFSSPSSLFSPPPRLLLFSPSLEKLSLFFSPLISSSSSLLGGRIAFHGCVKAQGRKKDSKMQEDLSLKREEKKEDGVEHTGER